MTRELRVFSLSTCLHLDDLYWCWAANATQHYALIVLLSPRIECKTHMCSIYCVCLQHERTFTISIYVNSIHVIFYFSFSFRFYWLVKFENAHFNRIRFERKQNTIKFKWNFPLYFLIDFSFYTTVTVLAVLSAYIGTFWSAFCTVRGEVAQNYFLIVESVAKIIWKWKMCVLFNRIRICT